MQSQSQSQWERGSVTEDFQGQHDYALGRTFIQWPLANFGKAAVVVITKAAESERLVDLVDSKSSRSWLWFKEVKVLSLKMSSSQQLFLSRPGYTALLPGPLVPWAEMHRLPPVDFLAALNKLSTQSCSQTCFHCKWMDHNKISVSHIHQISLLRS